MNTPSLRTHAAALATAHASAVTNGAMMLLSPLLLAGCAGSPPAAEPRPAVSSSTSAPTPRPPRSASWQRPGVQVDLTDCADATAVRNRLRLDFTQRELDFVGFDEVSLARCIEDLVAAELAWRTKPDEPTLAARRGAAIDAWVAAATEARFRRVAGAASCIPPPRD